jgi:putative transposase
MAGIQRRVSRGIHGIEHRLTKPYHAWTNGQAGRMVQAIKEAVVKAFHYNSVGKVCGHVGDWLATYRFAKQLRALGFETSFEEIN